MSHALIYRHSCDVETAPKFADWILNRGGVAVWRSVNLSNPGASWSTPARDENGQSYPKPTWEADDTPEFVVTDPCDIEVYEATEVKRFHVGVRRGDSGLVFKCTDASSRKIRKEVEKAGIGAFHVFDYMTQDAVIMQTQTVACLKTWMRTYGYYSQNGETSNFPFYDESAWAPLSWSDAKKDQRVWLRGIFNGQFRAYGPHTVADPVKRMLRSGSVDGARFMHYAESLLILKETAPA